MQKRTTDRLSFRPVVDEDASFVRQLLNEPGYMKFIGDRGIRTDEEAITYISEKFAYDDLGRGFYLACDKVTGQPLGFAGIMCREFLPHTDVGYAFVERVYGQGLASEATRAALAFGFDDLGLEAIGAIISHNNAASIRVVEKQGLTYSHDVTFPTTKEELAFYVLTRKEWQR